MLDKDGHSVITFITTVTFFTQELVTTLGMYENLHTESMHH